MRNLRLGQSLHRFFSNSAAVVAQQPQTQLVTVRVTIAHGCTSRLPNALRVYDAAGENTEHSVPDCAAPSCATAQVEVGRPIRPSDGIPAVVGESAALEVRLRSAELFVAAMTDHETRANGSVSQCPGVSVSCGDDRDIAVRAQRCAGRVD